MENRVFFEGLKRWSQRKHRLLGKYLPPFSAKVARTTRRREIFVVDGFAGAATYNDGSKGSPILIAEFGDVCLEWQDPVTLKLINIEADLESEGIFESLEKETQRWVVSGRVFNIRKEFAEAVPEILSTVGDAPSLFFVDPFGPTDLRFGVLRPILKRKSVVTELIINFDQDGLRRIVDAALSPKTNVKAADTNARNISEIVGSETWRLQIEGKELTSLEAEQILLREYCNNLRAFGFSVVAYPIREKLNTNPKYHFIYCTRHSDGLLLMNDFVREEEDQIFGEHLEDVLPLFSGKDSYDEQVNGRRSRLAEIVESYARAKGNITRGNLKTDLIGPYFGQFHGKDYNAVVQRLLGERKLIASSGKTRINDSEPLSLN